jgi:phosphoheptose isomerase
MPGRSTTDAMFIVRHLQEKYGEKRERLYHAFVDIEKAFDKVPKSAIKWSIRR